MIALNLRPDWRPINWVDTFDVIRRRLAEQMQTLRAR